MQPVLGGRSNNDALPRVGRRRVSHVEQGVSLSHDSVGIHRMLRPVFREHVMPRVCVKCFHMFSPFSYTASIPCLPELCK